MNCPYCMYALAKEEISNAGTFRCPKCRKSIRVRGSRYARPFGLTALAAGLATVFLGDLEGMRKVKIVGGLVMILAGLIEMLLRQQASSAAEIEPAEPGEFRNR